MFITTVIVSNTRNNKNNTIGHQPAKQGLRSRAEDKDSVHLSPTCKQDVKYDQLLRSMKLHEQVQHAGSQHCQLGNIQKMLSIRVMINSLT